MEEQYDETLYPSSVWQIAALLAKITEISACDAARIIRGQRSLKKIHELSVDFFRLDDGSSSIRNLRGRFRIGMKKNSTPSRREPSIRFPLFVPTQDIRQKWNSGPLQIGEDIAITRIITLDTGMTLCAQTKDEAIAALVALKLTENKP